MVGEVRCKLCRRWLSRHRWKGCGSYRSFDGLELRCRFGLRWMVGERWLHFLCRLSLLLHGRRKLDLRRRGYLGGRVERYRREPECSRCCLTQTWMSKVYLSTSTRLMTNSCRDERALGELLPGFGVLGWGLKCRLEGEMLRSRCLTESDSMPRRPTGLVGQ